MTAREPRRRAARWTIALTFGACLAWGAPAGALGDAPGGAGSRPAAAGKALESKKVSPVARLAVLVGKPGERQSELHLVPSGASASPLALGASAAVLPHRPFATYTAATVGVDVVVVLDEGERGDRSFASALLRMRKGDVPQRLAGDVAHASRPVPIPGTNEVVVARGTAQTDARGARADRLTLDAVDVRTGKLRTLYRATGSALHVAGTFGDEIVLDRIDDKGEGALVAVHRTTLVTRVIAPRLSPFARDFSIDEAGHAVVLSDRHEADRGRFVVDRIDLVSGRRDRLHEDTTSTLAPQIWPDGSLALTRDPQKPLERFDLGRGVRAPRAHGLPRGVSRIGGVDATGKAIAVTTSDGGALPVVSVVDQATGRATLLPLAPGLRATVAGFVEGGAP